MSVPIRRQLPRHLLNHDRVQQAERDFEKWWAEHMVDEESQGCLSPDDEEVARAVWMSAYIHFCED